jgi:hypothetical protein
VPLDLLPVCLAYNRCIKTDEPALDKVPLTAQAGVVASPVLALLSGWPVSGLVLWNGDSAPAEALAVSVGRTVVGAFRRLKLAFFGSIIMFALITLATGYILAGVVPLIAMLAYRPYVQHRYWLRARPSEGYLELRGVSEGFQTHVASVAATQKRVP